MKQQPDQLFNEKLANHSRPAPAQAWDRIESTLDKKNNSILWLKIAASFLVLCVASVVFWTTSGDVSHGTISDNTSHTVVSPEDHLHAMIQEKPLPVKTKDTLTTTPSTQVKVIQKTPSTFSPKKEKSVTPAETQPVSVEETLTSEVPLSNIEIDQPKVVSENRVTSTTSENIKPITLVFSAAETTAYLEKKNITNTEATSSEKKSSTFKRLLKKATDLKTNQDPFGDLRQMKNEILALDFKSDKKRGQNK